MTNDQKLSCTFTGLSVSRIGNKETVQDQHEYLKKLGGLALDAAYTAFRSVRVKLSLLANTRPDCLFENSELAQATEEFF